MMEDTTPDGRKPGVSVILGSGAETGTSREIAATLHRYLDRHPCRRQSSGAQVQCGAAWVKLSLAGQMLAGRLGIASIF